MKLVHFAHRILECGHVEHFVVGCFFRRRRLRLLMAERAGPSLLPRAHSSIPELDKLLKPRLQILKAETIRGSLDVAAIPPFHHRLDAAAGLPWRSRRTPGEKHVVFRLELLELVL